MKRVKIAILLIISILVSLTFPAYADSESSQQSSMEKQLLSLERVTGVTKKMTGKFTEKYVVTFKMPLDWKEPNGETFPLRVILSVKDPKEVTVFGNGGYLLSDFQILMDMEQDLTGVLNGNNIEMEYRFFGESIPEGLDHDKADLFEHLTLENAAADQHEVYRELSTVLTGPWVSTGVSKGGLNVILYAYYYPDDMDAWVSLVGPSCVGTEDVRFIENLYSTIGDVKYGEEKSRELQELILDTDVLFIKNRDIIEPLYMAECLKNGMKIDSSYFGTETDDVAYEMAVMESNVQIWQYFQNFDELSEIKEMLETDPEGNAKRIAAYLYENGTGENWSRKSGYFPYYVQAFKEIGSYRYDFSAIREAVMKASPSEAPRPLTITEDMEEDILPHLIFTEEQREAFLYDGTAMDGLRSWLPDTECRIMFIYGASDPWYAVRIDDVTGNDNVVTYVDADKPHLAALSTLPEDDRKEALLRLNRWLYGEEPEPDPDPVEPDSDHETKRIGTYGSPIEGAVNAEWVLSPEGKWQAFVNGDLFTRGWLNALNPYAKGSQAKSSWFYFNEHGEMLTGWNWITEDDGAEYCYYLNPVSDGTLGACLLNGRTPDGYYVNEKGQWIH